MYRQNWITSSRSIFEVNKQDYIPEIKKLSGNYCLSARPQYFLCRHFALTKELFHLLSVTWCSPSRRPLQAVRWCSVFARDEELLVRGARGWGGNCCTSRPVAPKVQLGCFTSHRKQVFIQKMTLAFFGPFRSLLHLSIGSFFKVFLKNIITCLVCICAVLTAPKLLLVVGPLQTSVWGFHAPYHRMEIWKYKYGNCDSCVYAYIEGISMYLVARLGIYFDLFWWFPEYKAVGVAAVQSWCPGLGFVAHR